MKQRINFRLVAFVLAASVTALAACSDNLLQVNNTDNPDVNRAYADRFGIEAIVSKLYQQMYNAQYGSSDDIWTQTITMSLESHSTLGNFGMGIRGGIPRSLIDNTIGNSVAAGNFRDFDALTRNARSAANAIIGINKFRAAGATLGSLARDSKARSFAFFNLGYAMGMLSMIYDSATILGPDIPSDAIPPYSKATDVNAAALRFLDSAFNIANSADASNGTGGWPIAADWVSSPNAAGVDLTTWKQIIRSFRARFRAGVARTPAERAAVDWTAVIADATNGIQSDFIVVANSSTGWSLAVISQLRSSSQWSQMTPMILGMGDTSRVGDAQGSYRDWIAKPLGQRSPFLMRTPDKHFPVGETRDAQITFSGGSSKAGPPAGQPLLYFRNRPVGEDISGEAWGTWYYDNHRFWAAASNGSNGPFVVFPQAENDMLAAEGYLRQNNFAAATALIDRYRVPSGLPAVTGIASATASVPGTSLNCVPNVPQAPSYTTTACGNLFEAMKWTKRVETNMAGYASWFMDSRGWGDLPAGTPLEWPIPFDELFAKYGSGRPTYTTSAVSAKGTYGF